MLFGCAENPAGPTLITSDKTTADVGALSGDNDEPKDKDKDSDASDTLFVAADTVSGLITSAGGELVLHIQGKMVEFVVPAGALADSVTISIIGSRYRVGQATEFYVYECGPSGLQFAIPMELTQLINRSDGAAVSFLYFDESFLDGDGIGWETTSVAHVQGGKGTFLINHFSKYGISYVANDQNQEITNENHCN